jgi:hypothetical protein
VCVCERERERERERVLVVTIRTHHYLSVLTRIVPHTLMIVLLISRFFTDNQYDKVCVVCLWVCGLGGRKV